MRYEMKDSGVEWVGMMPSDWQIQKAKYYITVTNGSDPVTEGEIPVYGSGSKSFRTCGEYKEGPAVLVGRKGSIDKPRYVTGRYWNVDTAFDVKTKGFDLKLYYYLAACFDYQFYMSQTTLPSMTQTNYRNMFLPIPPLPEQAAIAAYLDDKCGAIDGIISEAKATIDEYKSWKASVIFEAVTKGLDPNAEMKDSGVEWIGKIPRQWDVIPLKRYYDYSKGAAVRVGPFGSALTSSDITTEEGVVIYNQRTVLDNNFEENDTFVTSSKAEELTNFGVFPGDILITTRGSIGKIVIVPDNAPYGILHPCIIRFRVDDKKLNKRMLKYIFNDTALIRQQILYYSNSTTIDVLYSYTLKELVLPLIPKRVQDEIVLYLDDKCSAIDSIIAEKEALIAELETYKKSLIFETVTGKRRVC